MKRRNFRNNSNRQSTNKLEIDYDKLAESIVLAQKKTEKEKNGYHSVRVKMLRLFNGCIYITFSSLCFFGVYYFWFVFDGGIDLTTKIVISAFLGFLGIVLILFQKESLNESSQETKEHFSINLSFFALIIALIALFHSLKN